MMNQSLFSALWLEKVAIGITIGLIVMVAALNIVATLILLVMEKHKDIAILVSMGASRGAITRIFMLQGTVIGALGTFTGAVLGWGAVPHPRPLQADPRARGRLSDLVRAVHAAAAGRRDRDRGRRPHLLPGHHPSRARRRPGWTRRKRSGTSRATR